ncbi:MAG TPA: tRNA pseudouridine(38-40) synthase TruA [Dehalococcoidales bacterium]|nr:tRNA pseudouridine(38-40) synthase TruA [Dehalococcoidales bacterium]
MSKSLAKVVLVVEFNGTRFCGFQFQEGVLTVQGEIEKAVKSLTGEELRIIAASRTDSGVHAKGQVVSFRTESGLKPGQILQGLNHYLPPDIAVKEAYQVNKDFNIQKDAVSRLYHYRIFNNRVRSPLRQGYSYQVAGKLDLERMNQACRELLGEHDLASFITDAAQSVIKSTLKTVYTARLEAKGDSIIFIMEANSFLPHQVRNTVGTLIRIGQGKIGISEFKSIIEARKPGLAWPTAPAHGLYLVQVKYPKPLGEYHE